MTIKHYLRWLLCMLPVALFAQSGPQTPFEKGNGNQTATYEEAIAFYQGLADASAKVELQTFENGTDIGLPMHLVVVSGDGMFHPKQVRAKGRQILLVLNGIHPGESCGIDASMQLARDLVYEPSLAPLLEHFTVLFIPVYNVGGSLNRSCCSRANQVGPEMHGFRGNARNLDLNRDFIKQDSRNARTFAKIFADWMPDLFLDTHTTDGADYPYVMTWIPTHKDKLNPELAQYMQTTLASDLTKSMDEAGLPLGPYVDMLKWSNPPDSGLSAFMDSPRYSSGYASLYQTLAITMEAHMLKPYDQRVKATYAFMLNFLKIINRDRKIVQRIQDAARKAAPAQTEYVVRWKMDMEHPSTLKFRGYQASYRQSSVTGMPVLSYDRGNSYEKDIPYYQTYLPDVTVTKPEAYILPQAWSEVVDRMKNAGVEVKTLKQDVEVEVGAYYIADYETNASAYEGHYNHYRTEVRKENQKIQYRAGDFVIFTNQASNRYIVETMEPQATDSWFNWNYFDGILMRKEWFSPYLFDATAEKLLAEHPEWKAELEKAKAESEEMRNSDYMQYDFIYRKTQGFEKTFMRYPVGRLESKVSLPLNK